MANTITADEIRENFSQAMSAMYQQEVGLKVGAPNAH